MSLRIALAGNPNSGKTTLFNRLTGTRQTTGNWPGVTVEKKSGHIRGHKDHLTLIDLPGIYSLSPYSLEEKITRNYIVDEKPDVVVNIIDATNLERNLYFTLQLKKLGRPMVIALNMMDEILSHGDRLDIDKLSTLLDTPVIPISAKKGEGMTELTEALFQIAGKPQSEIKPSSGKKVNPSGKDIDLDKDPDKDLFIKPEKLEHTFKPETEEETEAMYRQAALIHEQVFQHSHLPGAMSRSDKIDRVMTHRILALPIFLLIIFVVFQLTFHERLGGSLTEWLEVFFDDVLGGAIESWLVAAAAPAWVSSLLVGGVIAGLGGVLSFLPQITLLFLFLTILEDTGYMARAAFIVDKLFEKMGLSGRSFIPMLMGFGCTVPAVMAARTLENERDRRLTIMITPFMSCGARMPIYALIAGMFFSAHKGLITFSMYILGMLVAIGSAFLLSKTVLKGEDSPFIIELPPYRLPDKKSLFLHVWDKVKDFLIRAGTIIFAMAVVVWFLQSFSFQMRLVEDSANSMFGMLGSVIAPLLRPLGFGTWQAAVALLTGLVAKESVVATLGILYTPETMLAAFTPLSAYAFMTFTLLYTPCLAAVGAIKREMNSWKWTFITVAYQTGVAYFFACLVYQGGRLLGLA